MPESRFARFDITRRARQVDRPARCGNRSRVPDAIAGLLAKGSNGETKHLLGTRADTLLSHNQELANASAAIQNALTATLEADRERQKADLQDITRRLDLVGAQMDKLSDKTKASSAPAPPANDLSQDSKAVGMIHDRLETIEKRLLQLVVSQENLQQRAGSVLETPVRYV